MLQLCYASTRNESEHDLLTDLSDILATSRLFNYQHMIFGVLYYAQGHFFQCLQGEDAIVNELFTRIERDSRHREVFRFDDQWIEHPNYTKWSMKYVHKHGLISSFFKRMGHLTFQPHAIEQHQLVEFIHLLHEVDENHTVLATPQGYKHRGFIPYF